MKARIETWKDLYMAADPSADSYFLSIVSEAKAEGKTQELNELADFLLKEAEKKIENLENLIAEYMSQEHKE